MTLCRSNGLIFGNNPTRASTKVKRAFVMFNGQPAEAYEAFVEVIGSRLIFGVVESWMLVSLVDTSISVSSLKLHHWRGQVLIRRFLGSRSISVFQLGICWFLDFIRESLDFWILVDASISTFLSEICRFLGLIKIMSIFRSNCSILDKKSKFEVAASNYIDSASTNFHDQGV